MPKEINSNSPYSPKQCAGFLLANTILGVPTVSFTLTEQGDCDLFSFPMLSGPTIPIPSGSPARTYMFQADENIPFSEIDINTGLPKDQKIGFEYKEGERDENSSPSVADTYASCGLECLVSPTCNSFSWNNSTKRCRLNNIMEPESIAKDSGWVRTTFLTDNKRTLHKKSFDYEPKVESTMELSVKRGIDNDSFTAMSCNLPIKCYLRENKDLPECTSTPPTSCYSPDEMAGFAESSPKSPKDFCIGRTGNTKVSHFEITRHKCDVYLKGDEGKRTFVKSYNNALCEKVHGMQMNQTKLIGTKTCEEWTGAKKHIWIWVAAGVGLLLVLLVLFNSR